ncbi:hypothetical protein CHLRE_02g078316v5 [Chlamydomonas reinhardtii]|uniref:Uncharacterized protein n=1 Tax=Chlamydomonas reinhardtii TaxID=3055 RepID=A0A2K3E0C0_CHLRE|nr:uncharacterized protein CHLRE_02g078316v5 [Chlamydomonas reinhardtii]PNW86238.1 hypothetical protein CHLRE_02g078316v5 [Chlamydomonas reinhardtii]
MAGRQRRQQPADDALPDWTDSEPEDYLEELRQEAREKASTKLNITEQVVADLCHCVRYSSLDPELRASVRFKLRRLAASSGQGHAYAEAALETPQHLYLLLHSTCSGGKSGGHGSSGSADDAAAASLADVLTPADLRRCRLTPPDTRRHAASGSSRGRRGFSRAPRTGGATGAAAVAADGAEVGASAGASASPRELGHDLQQEQQQHSQTHYLLGYCVILQRRWQQLSPTPSGASSSTSSSSNSSTSTGTSYCLIEFFDTLAPGYNLGQLLWRRAGQLLLAAAGSSTSSSSDASLSSSNSAGTGTGSSSCGDAGGLLLRRWPFPLAPNNILYWAKAESRIPELQPGGLLRAFRQLQAAAANGSSSSVDEGRSSRRSPPIGADSGAAVAGAAGAVRPEGAEGAEGDDTRAFRRFCEGPLQWHSAAVDIYLDGLNEADACAGAGSSSAMGWRGTAGTSCAGEAVGGGGEQKRTGAGVDTGGALPAATAVAAVPARPRAGGSGGRRRSPRPLAAVAWQGHVQGPAAAAVSVAVRAGGAARGSRAIAAAVASAVAVTHCALQPGLTAAAVRMTPRPTCGTCVLRGPQPLLTRVRGLALSRVVWG